MKVMSGECTQKGRLIPIHDFLRFQRTGHRPKGSGQVDVRRGAKGLGDGRMEADRGLLDLLGYG